MKSAAEVLQTILVSLHDTPEKYQFLIKLIESYAEERMKEALETKCVCAVARSYYSLRCKGCHGIIRTDWEPEERLKEARAEALEEAAKLVETEHKVCLPLMCETARKVRALGGKL